MRKSADYLRAGRKDPLSLQQKGEHPYDFVALPSKPAIRDAVPHERFHDDAMYGVVELTYILEAPMHVGSGVFQAAEECGLRAREAGTPVRGIVRRQGQPILPGSGWKGAVRARYEALTRSRLALFDRETSEKAEEVPGPPFQFRMSSRSHQVKLADPRLDLFKPIELALEQDSVEQLSPAESLFGCLGYRGRIHPTDGKICLAPRASAMPLSVSPLDSPRMHRLAKPGCLSSRRPNPPELEISEVEGRKFYYDGDIVHHRGQRQAFEYVDFVEEGSEMEVKIFLTSLAVAEVGALLVAAGYGKDVGILRFGGFKPAGLGKVRLKKTVARLRTGKETRSRSAPATSFDIESAIGMAYQEDLLDAVALDELEIVTRRRRDRP